MLCLHACMCGWSKGVCACRTFLVMPLLSLPSSVPLLLVPSMPSSLPLLSLPSLWLPCWIALWLICTCWGAVSTSARLQGVRGAKQVMRPRRVWFARVCVQAVGCEQCKVLSCGASRHGCSAQHLLGIVHCRECVRGIAAGRVVAGAISCARLCDAGGGGMLLLSRHAGAAD